MDYSQKIGEFVYHFIKSKALLCFAVFLLLLKVFVIFVSLNLPGNLFFADITKATLFNLVNYQRQSAGLNVLAENQKLDEAAEMKAQNMINENYFSHNSPGGTTPWYWFLQAGYDYKYAGENLAIGFFESEEVFEAWLNSPSHKNNMLNPNYKDMGMAITRGSNNNEIIVVQLFGSAASARATASQAKTAQEVSKPKENVETEVTKADKNPKVAGASSDIISQGFDFNKEKPYSKLANYMLYSYERLMQEIIYGFLILCMAFMSFGVIFSGLNSESNRGRQFIVRSLVIMAILGVSYILDKGVVTSIIPHQIII